MFTEASLVHVTFFDIELKKISFEEILKKHLNKERIIFGNINHAYLDKICESKKFITFSLISEPYEYLINRISFLYGQKKEKVQENNIQGVVEKISEVNFFDEKSIENFFESLSSFELGFFDNIQVRNYSNVENNLKSNQLNLEDAIKNIKKIYNITFYDRLNLDVEDICIKNNINNFDYKLLNFTNYKFEKFKNIGISKSNKVLINFLNQRNFLNLDFIFYKNAIKIKSDKIINDIDIDIIQTNIIFNLERIESLSIHGWAKTYDNNILNENLDVFLNCQYVGQFSSKNPRIDLKKSFGLDCGFSFFFDFPLNNGDCLSIVGSRSKNILIEKIVDCF